MKYMLRPGVVRVKICNINLLIPDRAASEYCSGVQKLSLPVCIVLDKMEKNEDWEIAYRLYSELLRRPIEEARSKIDAQLASLYEDGFLISAEDEI